MQKNQSYLSFRENLDFVRFCSDWNELNRLSENISKESFLTSKYKKRLNEVEDRMKKFFVMIHGWVIVQNINFILVKKDFELYLL